MHRITHTLKVIFSNKLGHRCRQYVVWFRNKHRKITFLITTTEIRVIFIIMVKKRCSTTNRTTKFTEQIVHRGGFKMPRGYGWVRNPKKYAYNKVYNKTTFDVFKLLKRLFR